jgi:hypothetical protein
MMMSRVLFFTVSFILKSAVIIADDPCRFEYASKGVIDLSALGNTNGTAAFLDRSAGAGSNYSQLFLPELC